MGVAERLEKRGKHVRAHRGGRADEELADLSRTQIAERVASVAYLAEGALGVREQRRSGIGERHPSRTADEQLGLELAFETLKARGEGRLREVQRRGGAAHVPKAGDLGERLELPHEHARIINPIYNRYRNKRFALWLVRHAKCPATDAMNTFDRTNAEPSTYRPILRAGPNEDRTTDFEQSECTCPELCQLDHDN